MPKSHRNFRKSLLGNTHRINEPLGLHGPTDSEDETPHDTKSKQELQSNTETQAS